MEIGRILQANSNAVWIPLTFENVSTQDTPAIHLMPIAWVDYERFRQMSMQPYSLHGANGEAFDNGEMIRLLLDATQPDAWRGFTRDDQPLAFDKTLLLTVLTKNIVLGTKFITEVRSAAIRLGVNEDAEKKI